MDSAVVTATRAACENCGTSLEGHFCHNCGQKELHEHDWSLKHFLHEAWHEIIHLDSKIFLTVRLLLLKPGELTRQYLAGRRKPFVAPVRLYLAITAIFFFFGAQADFNVEGFQRSGNASGLTNLVQEVAKHTGNTYAAELEKFNQGFHKKFSILVAFAVIGLGFAVHLMYRKTEHYYARSLIFAIHFFSLFFVLVLIWRIALHYLSAFSFNPPMQGFFVIDLVFLALSMHRVWPEPMKRFVPKLAFLWFTTILLYTLSIGLGIGLQVFTYGRIAARAFNAAK
jgi:hypothetical protein